MTSACRSTAGDHIADLHKPWIFFHPLAARALESIIYLCTTVPVTSPPNGPDAYRSIRLTLAGISQIYTSALSIAATVYGQVLLLIHTREQYRACVMAEGRGISPLKSFANHYTGPIIYYSDTMPCWAGLSSVLYCNALPWNFLTSPYLLLRSYSSNRI
jgi:hypothetical protein